MQQADHRREARQFLVKRAADTGWKIGTWVGLIAGAAVGRDFRGMVIGSVVGMAIGWLVGKYNSRLL